MTAAAVPATRTATARPGDAAALDGPALDAVFGALADPTRRLLLRRLGTTGPASATVLAEDLPVTRQAVVKHLRVLAEAGLVEAERHGREVRYGAVTDRLTPAMAWMVDTGAAWDRRLDRLRQRLAPPG